MKDERFWSEVQRRGGFEARAEADMAVSAVLATLAERLPAAEAAELAALLPVPVAAYLERDRAVAEIGERLPLEHFFRRVAEREGLSIPDAVVHGQAVIDVLRAILSAAELSEARTRLSAELDRIFEDGSQGALAPE